MFSVTNSTWTLLAIVPSSTVCVCEFLIMSVFYFNFACVCVRVYVQSNSTFDIDSHVSVSVCGDINCVLQVVLLCMCRYLFCSSHSLPQHEAQNQSTRNRAAHGNNITHACQLVGVPKKTRE